MANDNGSKGEKFRLSGSEWSFAIAWNEASERGFEPRRLRIETPSGESCETVLTPAVRCGSLRITFPSTWGLSVDGRLYYPPAASGKESASGAESPIYRGCWIPALCVFLTFVITTTVVLLLSGGPLVNQRW